MCSQANLLDVILARAFPSYFSYFPFSPIALKHRERQRGCALRHGGLLPRYCDCAGFGSSRFAGTL